MNYQLLAAKSLKVESMKVCTALEKGDTEAARHAVSMIVGRDTECLDETGITKAAIETVAENASDGVIAPLFYMLLFGPVIAFLYKAVNTMDSMVGYKNEKYLYFGRTAAKLDDLVNWLPSRLTAIAMIAAAYLLPGYDGRQAARIWKRDRRNHKSPNSAQSESACAGALGVQLAGDAYYFGELYHKPTIGDPFRSVVPDDIRKANRLMLTAVLLILVCVSVIWLCIF
jgi:adenosylcobinamide-phosphate synthase